MEPHYWCQTPAYKPFWVRQYVLHKKRVWIIDTWCLRTSKMKMGTLINNVYFQYKNLFFLVASSTKIGRNSPGFPFTFFASLGIMQQLSILIFYGGRTSRLKWASRPVCSANRRTRLCARWDWCNMPPLTRGYGKLYCPRKTWKGCSIKRRLGCVI